MPRSTKNATRSIPVCTLHKATGQARVRIDGKDRYCGRWGTPEAQREYNRLVGRWLQSADLTDRDRAQLTVGKLAAAYAEFARGHYVKNGRQTSQYATVLTALRRLVKLFRKLPVADLGPKRVKLYRQRLVDAGQSRNTVNATVGIVKQMVKWGLEEELIDGSNRNRALLVKGVGYLKQGRTSAPESVPVTAVAWEAVESIRAHVPAAVWGAIRLQWATGCRPCEALAIRGCDITMPMGAAVWEYRVPDHANKNAHRGQKRVVMIGPEGQRVLQDYLRADTGAFLFSPDADGARAYDRTAYGNAIKRGCERAFEMPDELRTLSERLRKVKREDRAATKAAWADQFKAAAEWRAAHCWSPNQLRHAAATRVKRTADREAARVLLGHSDLSVTDRYIDADLDAARAVAARIG